jgi:hypothetical protein
VISLATWIRWGGCFTGRLTKFRGPQQKAHLPLDVIRQYFPEVFDLIMGLDKIVIVRDPAARFLSAMSQRARETHKKFLDEMTPEEIRADFQAIVAHLKDHPDLPAYPFRHFIRQSGFARLDGEIVTEHVVPLERLPDLMEYLSKRTGRQLDKGFHSNQTVAIRNKQLKASLIGFKNWAKRVLPVKTYGRVRDVGLKLFAQKGVASHVTETMEQERFRQFVSDFYRADYELLEYARARNTLK